MPTNAELVDRLVAAFGKGDVDAALECLDADVELLPIRARLEGGTYRGHDGYRRLLDDFAEDWEGLRLVMDRLDEDGDRLLASGRLVAKGRASGVDLDVPLALLYEVHDGKVVRVQSFTDPEEARRLTGIRG